MQHLKQKKKKRSGSYAKSYCKTSELQSVSFLYVPAKLFCLPHFCFNLCTLVYTLAEKQCSRLKCYICIPKCASSLTHLWHARSATGIDTVLQDFCPESGWCKRQEGVISNWVAVNVAELGEVLFALFRWENDIQGKILIYWYFE